jgi:hypothetical protein
MGPTQQRQPAQPCSLMMRHPFKLEHMYTGKTQQPVAHNSSMPAKLYLMWTYWLGVSKL